MKFWGKYEMSKVMWGVGLLEGGPFLIYKSPKTIILWQQPGVTQLKTTEAPPSTHDRPSEHVMAQVLWCTRTLSPEHAYVGHVGLF